MNIIHIININKYLSLQARIRAAPVASARAAIAARARARARVPFHFVGPLVPLILPIALLPSCSPKRPTRKMTAAVTAPMP